MKPTQTQKMKAWVVVLLLGWCADTASAKPRDEKPTVPMKREPTPSILITNHTHIPTLWKFNPVWWFKNYDNPEPPDWMWPGDPHRHFKWYLRNPLNNFTFYVIGIADKTFVRVGKYPARVFAPDGGWNWSVCRHKCLRLPFVSYQNGRFEFYLGWRNRGNFGFTFRFLKPKADWLRENERKHQRVDGDEYDDGLTQLGHRP